MLKKTKGVSVQSIIIGSIVLGVIAGAGIAAMWPSVEKAKHSTISTHIKSQMEYVTAALGDNFQRLKDTHASLDNGDTDYLDELAKAGELKLPPINYFAGNASWEINRVVEDGYKEMFFITFTSDNAKDIELFEYAASRAGLQHGINIESL
jgi:hypothetical protein